MSPKNDDGKVSFEEYAERSSKREVLLIMRIQGWAKNVVPRLRDAAGKARQKW